MPKLTAEHPASTEGANVASTEHHAEPTAFGLFAAPAIVALAMTLVVILLIAKKVPGAIGKALDSKIDAIRQQLAEAETLRKEAEALKAEYQAKAEAADAEAAAMVQRAKDESKAMLAKAKTDAKALVERRTRMAEDKIAAEERTAVDEIRAATAKAATAAAASLIAERHDPKSDQALVDEAIGRL